MSVLSAAPSTNSSPRASLAPGQWAALLALFVVVYLASAFSPALQNDADATHAEAAREMALTGDFVTLHVNGIRYLVKAPLPYWLVAFSYRAFGVSEFSTRLPLLLSILLSMGLAARWAQRAFGPRAAVYAGLAVCTAFGVFLFTRIFLPEALLGLLISAALYAWLTALEDPSAARWYAGYVAMALAVLTKGLIGIVFLAGPALLFLALTGDWRRWREFRLAGGILVFLAIAAPWHILAGLRNPAEAGHPGFLWTYFVNEHFLRFLGKSYPRDYNKLPALAYWTLHLVWLFPWSIYLGALLKRARADWSAARSAAPDFAARTRLLCWITGGLILVFFSLSTNQEYYTFPAYIPLLLLLADALAREEEDDPRSRWLLAGELVFLVVGMAASLVLFAGLWRARHLPFVPDIGAVMVDRGIGSYTLSMSHFFDLTGASLAALRLPAALAAIALLAGPILAVLWRRAARATAAVWTVAATSALFLVAAHLALVRFQPYLSSKSLADAIQQAEARSEPAQVAIYGDQSYGSSLVFYLHRQVYLVNGRSSSMELGSRFSDAPPIFLDDAGLLRLWSSPQRVFLLVTPDGRRHVDQLLPTHLVLAATSRTTIYANR